MTKVLLTYIPTFSSQWNRGAEYWNSISYQIPNANPSDVTCSQRLFVFVRINHNNTLPKPTLLKEDDENKHHQDKKS